jgi:hypothetical protein
LHQMAYSWILNFTELRSSSRTTAVNKRYTQLCASRNLFRETYSASDQEVCVWMQKSFTEVQKPAAEVRLIMVYTPVYATIFINYTTCFDPNGSSSGVFSDTS